MFDDDDHNWSVEKIKFKLNYNWIKINRYK